MKERENPCVTGVSQCSSAMALMRHRRYDVGATWQVIRVPPYMRYHFPSKENRHIPEWDDIGPPVVRGVKRSVWDPESFAQGRRHIPQGAPSLRNGQVIGTDRRMPEPPCARQHVPQDQTESRGRCSLSYAGPRAPRGCVTRQRAQRLCYPTYRPSVTC